ncbi:hypothetical protein, conserved [Eimeria brunetti]|uniref:Transmembrane protein n=1 Tax=Eimeria brunetti TaxID=51314 RepID=U6LK82_9EIME|nr:hypothetical protein, conserved [Eimeria brunetti]
MGKDDYAAPHLAAEEDGVANGEQRKGGQNRTQNGMQTPDFARLKRTGRTPLSLVFTAAATALACTAVAYMVVSCALIFGCLSSSSKPMRLLVDSQGDVCAPQEGAGTESPAEQEGGSPALPLPETVGGGGQEAGELPGHEGGDTGDTGDTALGDQWPPVLPPFPAVEVEEQDVVEMLRPTSPTSTEGEGHAGDDGGERENPYVDMKSIMSSISAEEEDETYVEMSSIGSYPPTPPTVSLSLIFVLLVCPISPFRAFDLLSVCLHMLTGGMVQQTAFEELMAAGDLWQRSRDVERSLVSSHLRPVQTQVGKMLAAGDFMPLEEPDVQMEVKAIQDLAAWGQAHFPVTTPSRRRKLFSLKIGRKNSGGRDSGSSTSSATSRGSQSDDDRGDQKKTGGRGCVGHVAHRDVKSARAGEEGNYMDAAEAQRLIAQQGADVASGTTAGAWVHQHAHFSQRGLVYTGGSGAQGRGSVGSRASSPVRSSSSSTQRPVVLVMSPHSARAYVSVRSLSVDVLDSKDWGAERARNDEDNDSLYMDLDVAQSFIANYKEADGGGFEGLMGYKEMEEALADEDGNYMDAAEAQLMVQQGADVASGTTAGAWVHQHAHFSQRGLVYTGGSGAQEENQEGAYPTHIPLWGVYSLRPAGITGASQGWQHGRGRRSQSPPPLPPSPPPSLILGSVKPRSKSLGEDPPSQADVAVRIARAACEQIVRLYLDYLGLLDPAPGRHLAAVSGMTQKAKHHLVQEKESSLLQRGEQYFGWPREVLHTPFPQVPSFKGGRRRTQSEGVPTKEKTTPSRNSDPTRSSSAGGFERFLSNLKGGSVSGGTLQQTVGNCHAYQLLLRVFVSTVALLCPSAQRSASLADCIIFIGSEEGKGAEGA